MKNYVSIRDIIKICNIPQKTVESILQQHKIDTYRSKKGLAINFKDFYKIYTSFYNPSLFNYARKNKNTCLEKLNFADFESLFLYLFKKPYKKPKGKIILNQANLF